MRIFLSFLVFTFVVSACKTYSEEDKNGFDKTIKVYIKQNDLLLQKTSSGLYKKLISKGEGRILKYADSVSISYKGKLLSGKLSPFVI
jgi:FKBP-type peptidyl-prolyl cis-trans isomerase